MLNSGTAPLPILLRSTLAFLAALALLGSAPLRADDKGKEQIEKTIQAYQDTKRYHSRVVVTILQDSGRIKSTSTADYFFAFDRDNLKLLNDRTDFFMIIDQGKLSIKSEQIAGNFAKIDAPNPLTYEELLKSTSFVQNIAQPDMMYLTSVMPTIYLGGRLVDNKAWELLPPRADDPAKRPGLKAPIGNEELTYWIDPATQLITQVVRGPGPDIKGPTKLYTTYDIQIKLHNNDFPKDTFAFDAKGLTEVASIEAWLAPKPPAPAQGNPHPNPANPPAPAGNVVPPPQPVPVPGNAAAAPPADPAADEAKPIDPKNITLKTLQDKDINLVDLVRIPGTKVVVLTFWESWAKSCQQAMPKMQAVSDWMTENKTPGLYYAVNIREDSKIVKDFLAQNKLTLPVLLDTDGKASEFFIVNNLPKTIVLINGKEFKTFTGLSPNMDREIKSAIQEGLKRAAREDKAPATPPAGNTDTPVIDDSKV
jgi:thiol-disulfide isomerase/thioredoxin